MSNPETTHQEDQNAELNALLQSTPLGVDAAVVMRGSIPKSVTTTTPDGLEGTPSFPMVERSESAFREANVAKTQAIALTLRMAGYSKALTSIPWLGLHKLMETPQHGKLAPEWQQFVIEFGKKHAEAGGKGFHVELPGKTAVALSSEVDGATILPCANTVLGTEDFYIHEQKDGTTTRVEVDGLLEKAFRAVSKQYKGATTGEVLNVIRHYFADHPEMAITFGKNVKPDSALRKMEDLLVGAAAKLTIAQPHADFEEAAIPRGPNAFRITVAAAILAVLGAAAIEIPLVSLKAHMHNMHGHTGEKAIQEASERAAAQSAKIRAMVQKAGLVESALK